LSGGEHDGYDEPGRSLSNIPNGFSPGRHAAAEFPPEDSLSAQRSGQIETDQPEYPPGTKKDIRKPDRAYYHDRDGKVISTVAARRQEPRTDHTQSNTDDLTTRLTTMNTQGESLGESDSRRRPRHTAASRDEPQETVTDPRGLSSRSHIMRHGSQGPTYGPHEERSQSRGRADVHQPRLSGDRESSRELRGGIDTHLSNRPAQDRHKYSFQEVQGPGGLVEPTHGQPQQPTGNEALVSNDTGSGTRRMSMSQKGGLEPISELGPYKATTITGDNRYGRSKEMIDSRKIFSETLLEL
jgi:hypothetical protein